VSETSEVPRVAHL